MTDRAGTVRPTDNLTAWAQLNSAERTGLNFSCLESPWSRYAPSWKLSKSWRPLTRIEICNMKSMKRTKLEKMTKNWSKQVLLNQSNVIIEWFRCKTQVIILTNREDHLDVSIYAIQSRPNGPNLSKRRKTGQNRSFCTNVTVLLHDPDAKTVWYHYQIVTTI